VGQLEYKENHDGIAGHYLEYAVKSFKYDTGGLISKDDFRELAFYNEDYHEWHAVHYSSVTYATVENASSNISHSELSKLKDVFAWYEAYFTVTKDSDKCISLLAKKADINDID